MIDWPLVYEALTPDPLEIAKARVQTQAVGKIIRERRDRVHSALAAGARSIPTEQSSNPAGQRVAS